MVGTTLFSASLDCSLRRWSITRKFEAYENCNIWQNPSNPIYYCTTLSASALKEYNDKPLRVPAEEKESTGLTEEEERELAELMGSDDDE